MTDSKQAQAARVRELRARGWSFRQIQHETGVNRETARRWCAAAEPSPSIADRAAALPSHMTPPEPPARPPALDVANMPLLDVCRAMLAELRRRAKSTPLPPLAARYSADAATLAGLVLRLERQHAERSRTLELSRREIERVQVGVMRKLEAFMAQRGDALRCARCGCAVRFDMPEARPVFGADDTPPEGGADELLTDARDMLAWLLESTADAEAIGNEVQTQRTGRAAVAIAGFVARLEKAIAATRPDTVSFDDAERDRCDERITGTVAAIRERSLMCASCAAAHGREIAGVDAAGKGGA